MPHRGIFFTVGFKSLRGGGAKKKTPPGGVLFFWGPRPQNSLLGRVVSLVALCCKRTFTARSFMDLIAQLARELNLKAANIEAAVKLIDEGNTIPFISRYRKEATGGMDDVALRALDERLSYLRNLEQRKEDVILLIDAQGKLTPELEQQIREATQLQRVEDLYKPYRKKRMTRAQKAREAGLEPLANMIIMKASAKGSALDTAADYVNEEAGFDTPEKALAGAADIVDEPGA